MKALLLGLVLALSSMTYADIFWTDAEKLLPDSGQNCSLVELFDEAAKLSENYKCEPGQSYKIVKIFKCKGLHEEESKYLVLGDWIDIQDVSGEECIPKMDFTKVIKK